MKVSNFIEILKDLKEEHGDLDLIYSSDDEGNGFKKVVFIPSVGHWNSVREMWFGEIEMYDKNDEIAGHNEMSSTQEELLKFNAVCIN